MSVMVKQAQTGITMYMLLPAVGGVTPVVNSLNILKADGTGGVAFSTYTMLWAVNPMQGGVLKIAVSPSDINVLGTFMFVALDVVDNPLGIFDGTVIAFDPSNGTDLGLTNLNTTTTPIQLAGNNVAGVSSPVPLSSGVLSQIAMISQTVPANTAMPGFTFSLNSSTTHLPANGAVITSGVVIDGAVPVPTTNTGSAVSGTIGLYKIDLSAADLNGKNVSLLLSAPGFDQRIIEIVTG